MQKGSFLESPSIGALRQSSATSLLGELTDPKLHWCSYVGRSGCFQTVTICTSQSENCPSLGDDQPAAVLHSMDASHLEGSDFRRHVDHISGSLQRRFLPTEIFKQVYIYMAIVAMMFAKPFFIDRGIVDYCGPSAHTEAGKKN